MKFEDTVRYLMRTYPSIYRNRAVTLDCLFLRPEGGGYWVMEDPGPPAKEGDSWHPLARAKKLCEDSKADKRLHSLPEFREKDLEWSEEHYQNTVEVIKDILENLEERASGRPCRVAYHFYPLSNHCNPPIQFIPDDQSADWVMGAREICALLLACPFEETEDKNLARNRRYARKTLKDLDKRFGQAELPDVSYATWDEDWPLSKTVALRKEIRKTLKEIRK